MGLKGALGYFGAAVQEQISGSLIEASTTVVEGLRVYDLGTIIPLWIGSSVVSLLAAASSWRVRARD